MVVQLISAHSLVDNRFVAGHGYPRVIRMGYSLPSQATPAMLAWARKKAGFSIEEVAAAEKVGAEKIADWESGESSPSFAQLKKLAKRYKFPVMVFYLNEPPTDFQVVRDFRLLAAGASPDFSPALRLAIRSAQERQAWASTYLKDNDFGEATFVSTFKTDTNPEVASRSIRELLKWKLSDQVACSSDSEAFSKWKKACEDLGVFVFTASKVETTEMRGFALPDKYAPTIVVNSSDSYSAKSFTAIHELVHVLLGNAAVSGAPESEIVAFTGEATERFCNRVAAETLVPTSDFVTRVPRDWISRDDEVIQSLAKRYRVSRPVIALRLVEAGFATEAYYKSRIRRLSSTPKPGSSAPIPQHKLALSRRGERFARLALSAFHAGDIHGGELASLLNMRLEHLPNLESALFPMRVQVSIAEERE